jgi:acyl carrier protein
MTADEQPTQQMFQDMIAHMIDHIVELIRKPGVTIDENTPLVSSGLIDSMALVDLLLKLEDLTHKRIPAGKVQPKDMDTVAKMFATAERVGKPRK